MIFEASVGGALNVPATIEGNTDLHAIERLAFAMFGGQLQVTVWCICGQPYEFEEYSGHIGAVIWRALREAGVPEQFEPPLTEAWTVLEEAVNALGTIAISGFGSTARELVQRDAVLEVIHATKAAVQA